MEDDEMGVETWMPVYPADVLASCSDMSPSQFGAYMRLLFYAWQSGGVPNDMEAACRIAGGCTPADWAVVRRRLVVLDEGTSAERLSQTRLESERAKAEGLREKRQAALEKARQKKVGEVPHVDPHMSPHMGPHMHPHVGPHPAIPIPSPSPSPSPVSKNESPTEILGATRQKPRRTYRIAWTAESGFQGVTDDDLSRWKTAYPGVNLTQETARAHAWLVDNPSKGGKRNWAAFLNRWFGRVQDKGGSSNQPAVAQKSFRADAGQAMTAAEYADWKRARDREEFLKAKARKRGGGLSSIGEVIDDARNS